MAESPVSSSGAGAAAHGRAAGARTASRAATSGAPNNPPKNAPSTASGDALLNLVQSARDDALAALLENPAFDEHHVSLLPVLLARKDLPESIIERISKRTRWLDDPAMRQKLAAHPHASRRVATRLLREFHLLDLVQFSLQPATPTETRRLAEELIVGRIGQLPLGQKKMLARRGSAQVAGALLAESSAVVAAAALDNSFLTEAQVLKALSRRTLEPHAVSAIGRHRKWSQLRAVRVALVVHPHVPPDLVLAFLPELPRRDLEDLAALPQLPASARQYFQHELARRLRLSKQRPDAP
jgi:hypothetical protein